MKLENPQFWKKPLAELTTREWEHLCDGCGRCCLKKLIDDSSQQVHYTRVVCRYFQQHNNRCACYSTRQRLVPDCMVVREMNLDEQKWMPKTCAYRLRHEGKPLFDWHPLIAGSRKAMEAAGIAITGKVLSEEFVHEDGLEEHMIRWVKA